MLSVVMGTQSYHFAKGLKEHQQDIPFNGSPMQVAALS